MKNDVNLIKYKKNIFEKILDKIYLKIIQNKDIDKIFSKGSFLVKRQIVQEYGINYLCDNFELNRLQIIWNKASDVVKNERYNQVKNAILDYINSNLEDIDEIINKLPKEFSNLEVKNQKEEFTKKLHSNVEPIMIRSHDELFKALTEVRVILGGMDEEIVNCIPEKFMNFIEDNYEKNYVPNINPLLSLKNQKLLNKTKVLLAIIYKKYAILL